MDEKDVQNGTVPEGDVSSSGTSTPVAVPALTKADLEEFRTSFREELAERDKRLKQSTDDRIKAERGRTPTPDYGSVLGVLGDAEPEVKAKVYEDLIKRQQAQQYQAAQEEQRRTASEQFDSEWRDTVGESLVALGIKPDDKDINWGEASESKLARQKKIYSSAAKIVGSRLEGSAANAKKEAAETVAQAAVEAGLESNTAVSGGGSSSAKVFTRQQIADMDHAQYKANEKDIDTAYRAGNIK